jgi:hypothetical protein
MTRDQPWQPRYLPQPLRNLVLAIGFEWGIALHGIDAAQNRADTASEKSAQSRALVKTIGRQMVKDDLVFPALSRSRWRRALAANVAANVMRNLWAYVVIFCGHFPDGAEKFRAAVVEEESKPDWYLRQMLGTANFDAGPLLAFASGNLCYQIEHHLFPDLPSNRYAEIATRVRALCDKFDLPYTTGSLLGQYLQTVRTIHKLALPDRFLAATSHDAGGTRHQNRRSAPTPPRPRSKTVAPQGGAQGCARTLACGHPTYCGWRRCSSRCPLNAEDYGCRRPGDRPGCRGRRRAPAARSALRVSVEIRVRRRCCSRGCAAWDPGAGAAYPRSRVPRPGRSHRITTDPARF